MPYRSIRELPKSVKGNLPKHAQEIYKEAYNSASEQYEDEETAHKVAWSAVKKVYEKREGKWVKSGS
jgi:cation transport regulator